MSRGWQIFATAYIMIGLFLAGWAHGFYDETWGLLTMVGWPFTSGLMLFDLISRGVG